MDSTLISVPMRRGAREQSEGGWPHTIGVGARAVRQREEAVTE